MMKKAKPLLFLPILMVGEDSFVKKPACSLEVTPKKLQYFSRDGDAIVGGILQISQDALQYPTEFQPYKHSDDNCLPTLNYLRHLLVFIFAIEEINNRTDLLPNITLGFQIYDTCIREYRAIQSVLGVLSGLEDPVPNYDCHKKKNKVVGFIGHKMTSPSLASATLTGVYQYPQISYGAMNRVFNNKFQFPSFYRTVPDESRHFGAIVLLLKHFGWNWVGILSSDDLDSQRANTELKSLLIQKKICVEFSVTVHKNVFTDHYSKSCQRIARATSTAIIVYCSVDSSFLLDVILNNLAKRKIFILFGTFEMDNAFKTAFTLNGSLMVHLHSRKIPGLKDYLLDVNPEKYPDNSMLLDAWRRHFFCVPEPLLNFSEFAEYPCRESHNFLSVDPFRYDVENFRFSFSIYSAVYALAHALHKEEKTFMSETSDWKLCQMNRYLRRAHITTKGGEEIQFNEGKIISGFDLINIFFAPNKSLSLVTVGHFRSNGGNMTVKINKNAIRWNPRFFQTPTSLCSERCPTGYHKLQKEESQPCCHYCAPCPENEITDKYDMERCYECAEYQWPNDRRDTCIPRAIEYLSYGDTLGLCLIILSIFFCFGTIIIFMILIKYKDTPVVKANNRTLSQILLLSLILSFLCPLLFIGHPTKMSCLLRQAVFGMTFSVAISSILAKTITVVLAFKVTKPNNVQRKWLGKNVSTSVLIICSAGEIVICVFWLIFSPPFPEYNTQVDVGKMILQCNEGSVTAFYIVIGYMGGLAVFSFILAFLARKLPDAFNEAQYITFSMLVFCSVWISFIPAYLSTKGKYMVAVEVFAILSSSAGLLGCIFIPKCYIILLRPEVNVKPTVAQRRAFK